MHILTLSCPDRPGLVAAVSGHLHVHGCNIEEAAQFNDPGNAHFFMRIMFTTQDQYAPLPDFKDIAAQYDMDWQIHSHDEPVKTLILVSQWDHCLNDLLYRWRTKHLNIAITGIVSNHEQSRDLAEERGIMFHHLPVSPKDKKAQEQEICKLIDTTDAELIILARYMQILSTDFCEAYRGRMINIHHSFLPGFKGAKPYAQAYERGVKIIGATAHYVTSDLDEGPIIAQNVQPVDHTYTPERMQALGRDIEAQTLAKAVQLYTERRIFLNGPRTVIL
jgi:formyltetrahydrofolate deformylase